MKLAAFALVVCGLVGLGCVSYATDLGPSFAPARAPSDRAIVYLYRPRKLTGWMRPVHVVVDGQERLVMVGGYAVVAVRPGAHQVVAYSTGSAQNYVAIGFGGGAWRGQTTIDATAGAPTYVRLAAGIGPTEVTAVPKADAEPELRELHLSPGGALR